MSVFPHLTQAVRDLAWACFSSGPLHSWQLAEDGQNVADCGLSLTADRAHWLQQLDREPHALHEHLARKPPRRLGIYFEQLWHFFLEQDPEVELIAHNLAVRDQGRTLGEFDIIYWCHRRQRHFHLELAVKFYLGRRPAANSNTCSRWREWLGPNAKDRLDLKLEQMLQHQIRLGSKAAARDCLAALGVHQPAREIAIKGYLFQPPGDPLPPPFGYNTRCAFQRWYPVKALAGQLQGLPAQHFVRVPRLRWLSPVQAQADDEVLSRRGLVERLQSSHTNNRALLVAGLDDSGSERCRFFVTPNDWPASAINLKEQP